MFIAVDDSDVLQAHDVRIWQKEASKAGIMGRYNESVKAGTGEPCLTNHISRLKFL